MWGRACVGGAQRGSAAVPPRCGTLMRLLGCWGVVSANSYTPGRACRSFTDWSARESRLAASNPPPGLRNTAHSLRSPLVQKRR